MDQEITGRPTRSNSLARGYTLTVDTGGTFTDLIVADPDRIRGLYKSQTTPHDIFEGVQAALALAAADLGLSLEGLLEQSSSFVYSTTHGTNAILEGKTAKTAFLTTRGHPDILLKREGGKPEALNIALPTPEPYVPRSLTFEITERILADGSIHTPLVESDIVTIIARLRDLHVQAAGVCLLWSIINPVHEQRVGDLLRSHLPGVEVTLSHQLNPAIREYRRASATVIDASIKPLMRAHLQHIEDRLHSLRFKGQSLMATHLTGGIQPLRDVLETPLFTIDSGPALAPVGGHAYATEVPHLNFEDVVVIDAGGTSCDVSLVHDGSVVYTRDKWLGRRFLGHLTGLPAVDTRSIGAGGGSIASVDSAGLLTVGPASAGAVPGPACYGLGGINATVTDAALVLGFLDPAFFMGGRIALSHHLAAEAVQRNVAAPLSLSIETAAEAIIQVYTESLRSFIWDVTIARGIDPREALIVGGGGSAGLNIAKVAQELGAPRVLIPRLAAGLSALGGQQTDMIGTFSRTGMTSSADFAFATTGAALNAIHANMQDFAARESAGWPVQTELFCEARYQDQVWELDVPLGPWFFIETPEDVLKARATFDRLHQQLYSVSQPDKPVEFIGWRGIVRVIRPKPKFPERRVTPHATTTRTMWYDGVRTSASVHLASALDSGDEVAGPAVIAEETTTIVVPPGAHAQIASSHYLIEVPR
jgi:N-methylhydantoinase A